MTRSSVARSIAFVLAAGVLAPACGKKGPPLAPLRIAPMPVTDVAARRMADQVVLRFRLPERNDDNSTPVDLARVDVYALTVPSAADAPDGPEFLEKARVVGSVEVKPDAPLQASVTETLTPAALKPVAVEKPVRPARPPLAAPAAPAVPVPVRMYAVIPVSSKGRRGRAAMTNVPIVDPPAAPASAKATYSERAITLEWTPVANPPPPPVPALPAASKEEASEKDARAEGEKAGAEAEKPVEKPAAEKPAAEKPGAEKPAAEKPGAEKPGAAKPEEKEEGEEEPEAETVGAQRGSEKTEREPARTRYNVYDPKQLPAGPPINSAPLEKTAFEDTRVEFGKERCYAITAVWTIASVPIESAPSEPVCVTPRDTFPPPAPQGLGAVAAPGSISLIWNAVQASDLAGYVVLRGEAADDTLQALTPEPIRETTYRDTAVQQGVTYVYAVVAVDGAKNRSPESARVEETAR